MHSIIQTLEVKIYVL